MSEFRHPATRTVDQVDDFHGEAVADPYRWLEDTNDPETVRWMEKQNEATEAWLAAVPTREQIRARLTELWDYPKFGVPFEAGGSWFQFRNSGLQDQSVLFVADSPEAEGRVLLDPNLLSSDGTVAVPSVAVTDDGSLLAYATSSAGSDWRRWHVRDVATGEDLPDVVDWSKYGTASWKKDNSGFYYSALEAPTPGSEYLERTGSRRVLLHRLGTAQAEDELLYSVPGDSELFADASVTDDGRFVVLVLQRGTNPESQLHVLDLAAPEAGLQPLVADFESKAVAVANVGSTFYLLSDHRADRQRIVAVDLDDPGREQWREVVAERDAILAGARHCGGKLVCHYLEDACSRLKVFGLDGSQDHDIELPPVAALARQYDECGVEGHPDSSTVHFALTSFTDSGSLWAHDVQTRATRLVRPPAAGVDPAELVSEEVFVTASDGARIPLFLTRRRDAEPSGEVRVLLWGYGGFDVAVTPEFSIWRTVFVEGGGMLAVAVLRGGGEYGRAWHDAGRLAHKQRVFDDLCDCARWLVASGWTKPGRIAVNGGSNGGLLVGACLTQHPELFGAAVPEVGVLDMLRYHLFTVGWAWKSDFGDPEDPEQYRWLRAYSPLHHVVPGTAYPPTLIMTGDHDDRVVPGHSLKFGATLQAARSAPSAAPVLIRVETATGHGHGMPTSKAISERTDVLAFLDATIGSAAHGGSGAGSPERGAP